MNKKQILIYQGKVEGKLPIGFLPVLSPHKSIEVFPDKTFVLDEDLPRWIGKKLVKNFPSVWRIIKTDISPEEFLTKIFFRSFAQAELLGIGMDLVKTLFNSCIGVKAENREEHISRAFPKPSTASELNLKKVDSNVVELDESDSEIELDESDSEIEPDESDSEIEGDSDSTGRTTRKRRKK